MSDYDDLEDADQFGGDVDENGHLVDVSDLPPPGEVLSGECESMPEWLNDCADCDDKTLRDFLASPVVFYPGAGNDRHAIELFGRSHAAHCFVHADWAVHGLDKVKGYSAYEIELTKKKLIDLLALDPSHPVADKKDRLKGASWTILERDSGLTDDDGPARMAVLYIQAEAIWVYWNLWRKGTIQKPLAVVLQHHMDGNWTDFGDPDEPLYQIAREGGLPEWILVARDTQCWPGYGKESSREPGGDYEIPRRLARKTR